MPASNASDCLERGDFWFQDQGLQHRDPVRSKRIRQTWISTGQHSQSSNRSRIGFSLIYDSVDISANFAILILASAVHAKEVLDTVRRSIENEFMWGTSQPEGGRTLVGISLSWELYGNLESREGRRRFCDVSVRPLSKVSIWKAAYHVQTSWYREKRSRHTLWDCPQGICRWRAQCQLVEHSQSREESKRMIDQDPHG